MVVGAKKRVDNKGVGASQSVQEGERWWSLEIAALSWSVSSSSLSAVLYVYPAKLTSFS